jgi:hypothetical protein
MNLIRKIGHSIYEQFINKFIHQDNLKPLGRWHNVGKHCHEILNFNENRKFRTFLKKRIFENKYNLIK